MKVLLIDDGSIDKPALAAVVAEAGADVASHPHTAASGTPDAVILGARDRWMAFGSLAANPSMPVVAVVEDLAAPALEHLASAGASAVLPLDAGANALRAALVVAVARAEDRKAAWAMVQDLRDQLETRKLVERAKGILMHRLGMNEEAAFRRMQRASQNENRKLREVADSIVQAEKLFSVEEEPRSRSAM